MSVRIRLARHGRKSRPYYHIVVADSRAPRDGKFIERIGSYNPNTNPATIDLDFDKAVQWLNNGAQPSDTCRAILSYEGVLMKRHLLKGVAKKALTLEQAEAKFNIWKSEKEAKISAKKDALRNSAKEDAEKRLAAERKVNETRAQELAKKAAAQNATQEEAPAEEAQTNEEA